MAQTSLGGTVHATLKLLAEIGAVNVKADDSGCALNGQAVPPTAFPPDLNGS